MRKLATLGINLLMLAILATALLVPARAATAPSHPSGLTIVKRMVAALHKTSHVEVTGTSRPPKGSPTHYRLRYQSPNREDLRVTISGKGAIAEGGRVSNSLHYVLLGKTLYSSTDNKHWYKTANPTAPTSLDVVGLNLQGAVCCDAKGVRRGEQIWFQRATAWRSHAVYVIGFKGSSVAGAGYGSLYVDRHSWLPLHYDETTTSPSKSTGSFTLTYPTNFTILAPK